MDSTPPPVAPQPSIDTIDASPAPPPVVETSPAPVQDFESGGFVRKIEDFKIVSIISYALIMSASIYCLIYYRQAMNQLSDD
jgi:hypothetical protein